VDFTFCPELAELIRTQRAVGRTGRVFDGLGALSTVNNLQVLRSLMLERKPARTLEVGLGFGGSALAIAASHHGLGHAPAAQHCILDPFQTADWDDAALLSLERAGLRDYVDFRAERSSIALGRLESEGARFGLIYVDGSHVFEDVFIDAYFGFRLLEPHGVILFDDCAIDHVAKALSFVTANWSSFAREIDLSALRTDGGSLRYRAARRLGKVQLRAFTRTGDDTRAWDVPLQRF
jgi:predicted O-methyltransferase YrrM